MMRRTPMRRTGFRWPFMPPPAERPPPVLHKPKAPALAVMAKDLAARAPMVCDKANPIESEPYRRYVARLPCWMCHVDGYSQAAHADEGKGMGMKSDDRMCYPACGPHPAAGRPGYVDPGCHWLIGTSGRYTREERRALEARAGAETQQRLRDWAATDTVLRQLLQRIGVMPA
jgi:hypothetical protein